MVTYNLGKVHFIIDVKLNFSQNYSDNIVKTINKKTIFDRYSTYDIEYNTIN